MAYQIQSAKTLFNAALCFSVALLIGPQTAHPQPAALHAAGCKPVQDGGIWYDTNGLIVHIAPDGSCDGGDTSQREGWYWLGVWFRQNTPGLTPWMPRRRLTFNEVLARLEPAQDGVFYRNPSLAPWNNPYDKDLGTSRDQLIPLIAAMGLNGRRAPLERLWYALPEDLQGKHAFNGNWRSPLGQDGWNCTELKSRSCGSSMDCSLRQDNDDCSLQVDNRDCSVGEDKSDCSLQVDNRNCGSFLGVKDYFCEAQKTAQNVVYATAKSNCEIQKTAHNAAYAPVKASCEAQKAAQNVAYSAAKAECETKKATVNASYVSLKGVCETAKTGGKYSCEVYKASAQALCLSHNIFNGDLFGPAELNLVARAWGKDPRIVDPLPYTVPSISRGGAFGDTALYTGMRLRLGQAAQDPGDTGDDLNLIVELLVADRLFSSDQTRAAMDYYARNRPVSLGSYLGSYAKMYGSDCTDQKARVLQGIASGWKPDDVSPIVGAVRWYHRACTGANPALATLYEPIINYYFSTHGEGPNGKHHGRAGTRKKRRGKRIH